MAQKTQMVTIPLEEYKELLLKDKPVSSNDTIILERFLNELEKELAYTESTYSSGYIGNNMQVRDGDSVIKEFMIMLKYVDFERYMSTWNKVVSKHRNDEAMKAKMEQMNQAKELRKEQ